ncbi:DUF3859 domain-containing protein [Pseudoroseicyclus tamaricis]|uniref:DUF3859 domain-containing protein n=1 Tax=Pseudoroseicyclus tamaricis TaxID=2705421 RepID=A0A6B2JVU5_9RHOB|nr:DUF3859 domain-containing protein [Pseudoroseicyclus tamaricis]NDV02230.1 DUF3859 domain-containing protein [Pseudoroseicyclus tamaricis]
MARFRHALAALAFAAAAAPAAAEDYVSDSISGWHAGAVCSSSFPAGGVRDALPFIAETQVVPAALGIGFGVEAQSALGDIPNVTVVVTHPAFGGEGSQQQRFNMSISGTALSAFYYRLEEPQEVQTGIWRIEAQANGQVLYGIDFELIAPSPGDGLLRACAQ